MYLSFFVLIRVSFVYIWCILCIYGITSEEEVIPVSEAHELLNRIHDILDSAVSKQAGNRLVF